MNDYEIATVPTKMETTSLESMTKAEIDMQISTAKRYPRSIKQFMDTALQMVTLNEEVAASCNYALPRGGKIIEGASARFAEIIFSAWGNARAGARIVNEDARFVTSQGVCHDLQSNTMITFEVKRRVTNKAGKTFDDDMIGVTGNAAASIALRNAILKVIPKAYWQPLYNEARRVSMGDSKTLATRRADALAFMLKFGITLEMILAKFELKGVEDISLEHLSVLRAAATSIKDGEATAESLFPSDKPVDKVASDKGNDAVKDKLKKKAAEAAGADTETGEIVAGGIETVLDSAPEKTAESLDAGAEYVSPVFNIDDHELKTQAGIKAAVTDLANVLAHYPADERPAIFLQSQGGELVSAASRAGVPNQKEKFIALGVKL